MQEQVGSGHVSDSGKAPLGRSCRAADPHKIPIDPIGNLTSKTEGTDNWVYTWNAENQLTKVEKNGSEVARFGYDPSGRRVEKVAGGLTTTYTYDGTETLRESRGSSTLRYLQGMGVDEPLAVEDGGAVSYFHADALGSIAKMTNATGATTLARQYDAWGNIETDGSEPGYAFTGREWDPETKLYYYRARYYDPKIGRFTSEDPIRFMGGGNFYTYVSNRPTALTDPMGLCECPENKRCPSGNWLLNGGPTFGGGFIRWWQRSSGTLQCEDRPAVQRPAKVSCGGGGFILGAGLQFDQQYNPPWAQTGVHCADDLTPFSFKQWMGTFFVVAASGPRGEGLTNFAAGPAVGAGFAFLKCDVTPQ